jgi:hypothetical protein
MHLKLECQPDMNGNITLCFSLWKYSFLDLGNNLWKKNTPF